jgi:hypothetical protein
MKKTLIFLCAVVFSTSTIADHHAPASPPGILEAWQCNYKPGKNFDDLMSARDYLVKRSAKASITPEPSFVWSLYKGDDPIDFVWFTAHANMLAFGAAADRDAASDFSDVQARFDSVADCTAGMGMVMPVFERTAPGGNNAAVFISSSACNLKHGANQSDMKDLTGHASQVFSRMDDNAPSAAYYIEPLTGSNGADRYLFQIHSNVSAWTKFVGNIVGSPEGQMLLRHRDKVLDCGQSLWNGQMVVGSMGQE